ncbi:hypothetical protein Q4595_19930, partial [Wenyingzhuangia sp. 1_MG-2023]|nr:hypothetical protein [Wenyingzhuangia sp. 1_MG-2023]
TLQSNEAGTVYLVGDTVAVTTEADILSADGSLWTQAVATADVSVAVDSSGLAGGNYTAYAVDSAGNISQAADETVTLVDTSTVVFDLVNGSSSDHSGRTFEEDTSYTIYVRVDSSTKVLNTDSSEWGSWANAEALGSDDQ